MGPRRAKHPHFIVYHYAAPVSYLITGLVDKNKVRDSHNTGFNCYLLQRWRRNVDFRMLADKMMPLLNKWTDWPPNYHRTARASPQTFCTLSFNKQADFKGLLTPIRAYWHQAKAGTKAKRINGKHQRKFLFSRSLSLGLNIKYFACF